MDKQIYDNYVKILRKELVPALGCTEPIAIAYASARAAHLLGYRPESIELWCSGNIVKNAKSVTVPHSGGQRGIDVAAILGAIAGDSEMELEVLEKVTPEHVEECRQLVKTDYCLCHLKEGVDNLYIRVLANGINGDYAVACLESKHTFFSHLEKNGTVILNRRPDAKTEESVDMSLLNVKDIVEFADALDVTVLEDVLSQQLQMNSKISAQGLSHNYGTNVGRTLLDTCGCDSVFVRARARAASGSDARMNGCPLPVVINAGSGNQGITVSLPILEYAETYNIEQNLLYKALALGNLISLHLKRYIGNLSAYCGATNASCGAACGIAYMMGGDYRLISDTIINTIGTIGGMLCDGAKSSCAAKISVALESAFNGLMCAQKSQVFKDGEGLVDGGIEQTIRNIGRVGKNGMRATDIEILNVMLHH